MTKTQKLKQARKLKLEADKAVELAAQKLADAQSAEDKKQAEEALGGAKREQKKVADALSALEEVAKPKPKSGDKSGPSYSITSKNSRRRAGLKFGPLAQTIHASDLSEKLWAKIKGDPELKIVEAE